MTTNQSNRKATLKPAGWLAVVVLAGLVIGLIGVFVQPLTDPFRGLPASGSGAVVGTLHPTITPYVAPSITPVPSATPLPDGWTQAKSLSGQVVFVPPPDIEQVIKAAFNTAWACEWVEDAPDADLRQIDQTTLCRAAREVALAEVTVGLGNDIEIITAGPLNPIQCATLTSCDLARAKLEVRGVVLFGGICDQVKQSSPCVVRQGLSGLEPNQLRLATIARQEDGTWKIVKWIKEKLPGPPPAP